MPDDDIVIIFEKLGINEMKGNGRKSRNKMSYVTILIMVSVSFVSKQTKSKLSHANRLGFA